MPPSVTVFCGSREGRNPAWRAAAIELGRGLAERGIRLVYGGGRVGLMGAVADAALAAGGQVLGVIPEFLTKLEVAHAGLTELVITDSMHARKRLMFDHAHAFVTLPGGLGTLEETLEIITWKQLGLHDKPIIICDVDGWSTEFVGGLVASEINGFADSNSGLVQVVGDVAGLLKLLSSAMR